MAQGAQLHDGTLEGPEGVADVESKADALTEQELARQDLVAGGIGKLLGKGVDAGVRVLGLCAKEKTGLEHLGRRVGHDTVGEEEAAQEDGRGGANLGREATELGGTEGLDGVEAQQLFFLGRSEEVRQRGLVSSGGNRGSQVAG